MPINNNKLKIAFIIGVFPAVSETFIINQVADLQERGIDVEIFSFKRGDKEGISQRFFEYNMDKKVKYLEMPRNRFKRVFLALPKIFQVLCCNPFLIFRIFNIKKYGRDSLCLKLLFWVTPFLGTKFDLVHCHFGNVANRYLMIREILQSNEKLVTSFYGFDVSMIFKQQPASCYDELKKICSLYFVMSNNMKDRIVAYGFLEKKIKVLPVSINVPEYPYQERGFKKNETINIFSVGRFVEKKGFDDLLRAIAIVKEKTKKAFRVFIVGGGPLEKDLHKLTADLKITDVVEYKGYMKIEKIIKYFLKMHLFVQPSKTARDGDME